MSPFSELFRQAIVDFHEKKLPTLSPRQILIKPIAGKITSLTGVRRSGKTYCLYEQMAKLLKQGISKENLLFINFEDERLEGLKTKDLSLILTSYYELYPAKRNEKVYVFFDEIQNVTGWERFIRRINDSENVQIYITGSSAKLLSKEIATSLRGRTLNYEIFPFSFQEYLTYLSINKKKPSTTNQAKLKNAYWQYLEKGGFLEVLTLQPDQWRMVLQDYLNLIVYRDVVERYHIKNHTLIKYLIKHLLKNIASPFSINKLYRDLKSQGFSVAKDTLHQYLAYLEDAYCFFSVPIFSESIRTQSVNYRKIYSVDTGFVSCYTFGINERRGQFLENLCFLHLRRNRENEIYYYKTKQGFEINFLVLQRGKVTELVQVCESLSEPNTRKRELKALEDAMAELKISKAKVLTLETEERIKIGRKTIEVLPAYGWIFGNSFKASVYHS